MARKELAKMTDIEYKSLSAQDLMLYNKSLPEVDYENPYEHQEYPRWMFRKNGAVLDTALINSAEDLAKLGKGWEKSPSAFGVQTAPGKPTIEVVPYTIPIINKDNDATTPDKADATSRP